MSAVVVLVGAQPETNVSPRPSQIGYDRLLLYSYLVCPLPSSRIFLHLNELLRKLYKGLLVKSDRHYVEFLILKHLALLSSAICCLCHACVLDEATLKEKGFSSLASKNSSLVVSLNDQFLCTA